MDGAEQNQKTVLRRPVRQYTQDDEKKPERIKIWMAACLIIVAFCIDLTEFVLEWLGIGIFGLSTLISVCATFIFAIWLKILSVGFFNSPKRLATSTLTPILEMVPALDALGGFIWTLGMVLMVLMTRSEDKGGHLAQIGQVAKMATGK
ncbi:MAG: hypothetical protein JW740_01800 [Candidatus Zambryskibacteria bacterium]|nr:hypothetical protein [Candidatus Zambryskibacteria bacterium]